ncbi:MAG: T9SS type A sorting domain-containing protein, partial [Flavobacterium sp.]
SGTDFWVVKLDIEGTIVWQETYNYGKVDILTSIIENKDSTFLIGGYAQSEASTTTPKNALASKLQKKTDKDGINDYIALKINNKGEEIWSQTVGSSGEDLLKKLVETRDGGYLLAGTSKGKISKDKNSAIGGNDFWVVKLKDKTKPDKEKPIIEAFPNPTVQFTNVIVGYEFESGTATVYDLSGHQLQSFEIKDRTIPIDLAGLPIGIYIVEINTNKQKDSVKIIKSMNKN